MYDASETHTKGFWYAVLAVPRLTLGLALIVIVAFAAGLANVTKDPSVDAFVPADHRFALARDEARETFGLEDPIIVGIASTSHRGLFSVEALGALQRLDDAVRELPGVRGNEVRSLASVRAIWGEDGDLAVEWIIPRDALTPDAADIALERLGHMPMLTEDQHPAHSGFDASDQEGLLHLLLPDNGGEGKGQGHGCASNCQNGKCLANWTLAQFFSPDTGAWGRFSNSTAIDDSGRASAQRTRLTILPGAAMVRSSKGRGS